VSVDKIVKRECHTRVFGEVVQSHGEASCLDACADQRTNVTSPCYVDCTSARLEPATAAMAAAAAPRL
jgi:hypothetical protein